MILYNNFLSIEIRYVEGERWIFCPKKGEVEHSKGERFAFCSFFEKELNVWDVVIDGNHLQITTRGKQTYKAKPKKTF